MFKKLFFGALAFGLGAVLFAGAVTGAQAAAVERGRGPSGGGPAAGQGAGLAVNLPAADPAGLSTAERDGLVYMREEEKLARDVYTALYAQWQLPVFQNISRSEQQHMDALKVLLDRYGVADPATAQAGVFTNPDLQKLYTDLVARGSQSVTEALKVGTAIEELDIRDLGTRLAQTDQADLQQVYGNLRAGSENHRQAFSTSQAGGAATGAGRRP